MAIASPRGKRTVAPIVKVEADGVEIRYTGGVGVLVTIRQDYRNRSGRRSLAHWCDNNGIILTVVATHGDDYTDAEHGAVWLATFARFSETLLLQLKARAEVARVEDVLNIRPPRGASGSGSVSERHKRDRREGIASAIDRSEDAAVARRLAERGVCQSSEVVRTGRGYVEARQAEYRQQRRVEGRLAAKGELKPGVTAETWAERTAEGTNPHTQPFAWDMEAMRGEFMSYVERGIENLTPEQAVRAKLLARRLGLVK